MQILKNQYLFIKDSLNNVESASCQSIMGYHLYCGEYCRSTIVQEENCFVALVGYAINTENPIELEYEMCEKFLNLIKEDLPIEQITDTWNGRWAIIFGDDKGVSACSDCCGLKQLFYSITGTIAIASQSRYIAEVLSFPEDVEAKSYIEIEQKKNREFSFSVETTSYLNVRRLLPNHLYSSESRSARRLSIDGWKDALNINSISKKLQASIEGACLRFDNVIETLTAGLDSRLVLAHSKSSFSNIQFVTFKYVGMPDNHNDLVIPCQIKKKLNLNYKVIQCSNDDAFKSQYKDASEYYHEYWIQMAHAVSKLGGEFPLLIKGACSEIARNPFGPIPNKYVTAELLCKLFQISNTDFSLKAVHRWIDEAIPFCKINGYLLTDLFYWEHRMGSWLATCLNESDVVCDSFTPFNTREILRSLLNIDVEQRISPKYSAFQQMLKNEMPEVISIPVNPERYSSFLSKCKCVIKNRFPQLYLKMIR